MSLRIPLSIAVISSILTIPMTLVVYGYPVWRAVCASFLAGLFITGPILQRIISAEERPAEDDHAKTL
jgi:hypothetical protein